MGAGRLGHAGGRRLQPHLGPGRNSGGDGDRGRHLTAAVAGEVATAARGSPDASVFRAAAAVAAPSGRHGRARGCEIIRSFAREGIAMWQAWISSIVIMSIAGAAPATTRSAVAAAKRDRTWAQDPAVFLNESGGGRHAWVIGKSTGPCVSLNEATAQACRD